MRQGTPGCWRNWLAAVLILTAGVASGLAPAGPAAAQDSAPEVLVISRDRVLRQTEAAAVIREAERTRTAAFQKRVDRVKRILEEEEAELTELRTTLARDEFDARVEAFDRKVRRARRLTQKHNAEIRRQFRRARDRLIAELGPILIELLKRHDADLVLDADQILVAAPRIDMTDEVIDMFDARVDAPEIKLPELPNLLGESTTPPDPEGGGDREDPVPAAPGAATVGD